MWRHTATPYDRIDTQTAGSDDVPPVTFMPDPGVRGRPWSEVRQSIVVDLGGEPEEAAVGAGVCFVSSAGQAALLLSTLQSVQGPVLQVRGLLHNLSAQDQVWGRWEGESHTCCD